MVRTARELLEDTTGKLAPAPHANRLLPLIARGAARRSTLAALAHEQRHVIAADRRAFLHLAERPDAGPESAAVFALLAEGEALSGPGQAGCVRRRLRGGGAGGGLRAARGPSNGCPALNPSVWRGGASCPGGLVRGGVDANVGLSGSGVARSTAGRAGSDACGGPCKTSSRKGEGEGP